MLVRLSLGALFTFVISTANAADICPSVSTAADSTIKSFVNGVRGVEYCKFRETAVGDLDGDAAKEQLVSFTIEGPCYSDTGSLPGTCGNNYKSFLIAFVGQEQKATEPVQVGGKGIRYIQAIAIDGKKVVLDTVKYASGDAQCCPSVKMTTTYELRGDHLVEIVP